MPLLLAFTVIGGVSGTLYLHEPFESSRPKEAKSNIFQTTATELVPARAWQDPFSAVARCREEQATDKKNKCRSIVTDPKWPPSIPAEDRNKLLIMPVMVYGGAYSEDVETRRRRRYAVLSAMAMQDYRLSDAENIGYFTFPKTSTPSYVVPYEWLQHNTAHEHSNSNHFRPPILLLWLDEQRFGNQPICNIEKLLLSVEANIKKHSTGTTSQYADKNTCKNTELKTKAISKNTQLKTKVILIGPAGSALLNTMVKEAHDLAYKTHTESDGNNDWNSHNFERWEFSILSPTATASAKLILGHIEEDIRDICAGEKQLYEDLTFSCNYYGEDDFTSIFLIERIFNKIGIDFYRTTSSDRTLAKKLVDLEFKNRRINVTSEDDIVVLVSEWDTFYGRALPDVFKRKITEEVYNQKINDVVNEQEKKDIKQEIKKGIRIYYYMRGLDGEIVSVNGDTKTGESVSQNNSKTVERSARELERAVGVNRFDYLRRLSYKIEKDLSDLKGKVSVIGVLGSDVYDKLLVVQAMRSSFPNALFFTTDADIRFVHPAEFKWTRNLIVLSGFDLKLNETELLQKFNFTKDLSGVRLSSFRDSYQTAIFLTTRLAVARFIPQCNTNKCFHDNNSELDRITLKDYLSEQSKTYEVGRSRFIPLGENPWSWSEWWDDHTVKMSHLALFVVMCLIMIYILFALFNVKRVVPSILGVILVGTLALWVMYCINLEDGKSGEPLPFISGTNSLPTIAILLFTIISAAFFIIKVYKDLIENRKELTDVFEFNEDISEPLPTHEYWKIWWGRDFTLDLIKTTDGLDIDRVWASYQRAARNVVLRAFFLAFLHTVFYSCFRTFSG